MLKALNKKIIGSKTIRGIPNCFASDNKLNNFSKTQNVFKRSYSKPFTLFGKQPEPSLYNERWVDTITYVCESK